MSEISIQKIVNDTYNKKNPIMILKVDWPMIVNAQGLKEAKTKQIGLKLLFQIVRKWGYQNFVCYKVVVKLFCFLECRLSEEACKLGQLCSSEQYTRNIW